MDDFYVKRFPFETHFTEVIDSRYLDQMENCTTFFREKGEGTQPIREEIIPLRCHICPQYDPKTGNIYYFESPEKALKNVWTSSKPGKFLKKVLLMLTDVQVEQLVNIFKVKYKTKEYTLFKTMAAEEIKNVYASKELEPYSGSFGWSCINASCMRHEFPRMENHPSEVYASGDFELWYVKDQNNRTCARTLVVPDQNSYVNIYAGTQMSGEFLAKKLEEEGFSVRNFNPIGLRIRRIEGEFGDLVGPYFDFDAELEEKGDYLYIVESGEYAADQTNGHLRTVGRDCCSCGYNHALEDMIEIDGDYYCTSCTSYCDYYNEHFVGESFEVNVVGWDSRVLQEYWCETAVDNYATEIDTEYWKTSDLLKAENGDLFTIVQLRNGEYVEHEDKYYTEEEYEKILEQEEEDAKQTELDL